MDGSQPKRFSQKTELEFVYNYNTHQTKRKKEGIRRKVEENERMSTSCLSGYRVNRFRSRTGLLNAEVIFILLNGFVRQADSNVCYLLNLFYLPFHCFSASDGKLASVTFC